MKALRRCRNSIEADNAVLIDLDTYDFSNVIVIDVPENHTKKQEGSNDKGRPLRTYIYIDDDEIPNNHHSRAYVDIERNVENGASSSRRYGPDISPVKLSKGKRTYSGRRFTAQSDSDSSDDDSLDCEFLEDITGKVREQWERASLKRKADAHTDFGALNKNKGKQAQAFNFKRTQHKYKGETSVCNDNQPDYTKGDQHEESLSDCDAREDADRDCGKTDLPDDKTFPSHDTKGDQLEESLSDCDAREDAYTDCGKTNLPYDKRFPSHDQFMVDTDEDMPSGSSAEENEKTDLINASTIDDDPVESSIIDQREKLKETDEYKQALEQEWIARQAALRIQAEEAQQLRRLQKRKKAESLRLLDMERRQKQRVEEIRETQKKDEENMNLKEQYRMEVIQELKKLEITCHDMASLLGGLGIQVGNGPVPLSHEVRSAYKRALLSFHPDRASASDMRQQVEAEEKFKLISRMKEKLSF